MMSVLSLTIMQMRLSSDIFGNIEALTNKCMEISLNNGVKIENSNKSLEEIEKESIDEETSESTDKRTNKKSVDAIEADTNLKYDKNDNTQIGIVVTNGGNNIYHSSISMESEGTIRIYYGKNLNSTKSFNNKITISDLKYFKKNKYVKITSDKKITIKNLPNNSYEGDFFIYHESDGFVIVNNISVEKYLYSVVASEMPVSFEKEALKSQAVCARTFTYSHLDNDKYKKYNAIMDDTTSYQAYGKTTDKKIKEAVKDTRGEVLSTDEGLISAYYFSTSCGYTTDDGIWGRDAKSYLKSKYVSDKENVVDVSAKDNFKNFINNNYDAYESKCSFYRWKVTINSESIKNKIYECKGENIGNIKNVEVRSRGAGGIVSEIVISGEDGSVSITNQNEIRKIFSPQGLELKLNDGSTRTDLTTLPSAFFAVDKVSDKKYQLTGGGFGHGSGMSQYGANEMAKEGMNYKEILEFFYSGVICGYINTH